MFFLAKSLGVTYFNAKRIKAEPIKKKTTLISGNDFIFARSILRDFFEVWLSGILGRAQNFAIESGMLTILSPQSNILETRFKSQNSRKLGAREK